MADKERCRSSINKLAAALAAVIVYNLLLTAVVGYAGYYAINRIDKLQQTTDTLQQEVELLKTARRDVHVNPRNDVVNSHIQDIDRDKREVISSSDELPDWIKNIQTGPQGPPGAPGKDGRDGRDGRDSPSLAAIENVINVTVEKVVLKEWTAFSSKLPTYGGATYVRWGRTVCPATSKLVYKGQMSGPDRGVSGGGANYQCLPEDPEYEKGVDLPATWSDLMYTVYWYKKGKFNSHIVPCAVCETEKRVTKLMIPAKTRCPTSEWVLEYKGYLYSAPTQHSNNVPETYERRTTYECVDSNEESLTGSPHSTNQTSIIYRVKARCSGDATLTNCPPYQSDKALSCVVCSK